MCGLDYENIFNPVTRACKNIKRVEEELQVEVTKAMEGPAGYFREPGGYIIDIRNRKKSSLPAVHLA
jgi:hypothetical protein